MRNVKHKSSSPISIPYFVPTLYIPKPTVIDQIGAWRQVTPCVYAPFFLACQLALTSHGSGRMTPQPSVGSFNSIFGT